ncbi:QueT transporter family protein [Holzapfeliella sp. JNUCC 80]
MNQNVVSLTKTALVTAIYLALGFLFQPVSFGPLQFRVAEITNPIAVFNKRYVWGITIGCFLFNLISSPNALIDMGIGTANTLVMTGVSYLIAKKIKNYWTKLLITPFIGAISMFMIAAELYWFASAPFWITYGTLMVTQFAMMLIGAVIFGIIEEKTHFFRNENKTDSSNN